MEFKFPPVLGRLAVVAGAYIIFAGNLYAETEPIHAPPPQPAPEIPAPLSKPVVPLLSAPPDPQLLERAKPRMNVYRNGSDNPQIPVRRSDGRMDWTLVVGTDPVTAVLQFDPSLVGKPVSLLRGIGLVVLPSEDIQVIGLNGQVVLVVALDAEEEQSGILLEVEGVATWLRFFRAPLWAVVAKENAAGGGQ